MKIAREFELRLERLVDGISAALFRGRMHPVDLANRLVRYVDLNVEGGPAGPEIANQYTVRVNPAEIDPAVDDSRLAAELASVVAASAEEQGWRIGGPIAVAIVPDPKVAPGSIRCDPEHVAGPLSPWCLLVGTGGASVHEIGDNRVLIGRADDVDVRIDHARISRHHALLFRARGAAWIKDLGSANGTQLNGEPVEGKREQVRTGDAVSFGPATFTVKLA